MSNIPEMVRVHVTPGSTPGLVRLKVQNETEVLHLQFSSATARELAQALSNTADTATDELTSLLLRPT